MALLTRVKSLLDFPLKNFPQSRGRYDELYDLRATCTRAEGYFLVKCDIGDYFESAFPLMMEDSGSYMLGQILASESKTRPDAMYYDVYIHGGSLDATAFCVTPEELVALMRELDTRGMEFVFSENEVWSLCEDEDHPFDTCFTEFPTDLRFAIMFGEDAFSLGEDQNKSLKSIEEYLE